MGCAVPAAGLVHTPRRSRALHGTAPSHRPLACTAPSVPRPYRRQPLQARDHGRVEHRPLARPAHAGQLQAHRLLLRQGASCKALLLLPGALPLWLAAGCCVGALRSCVAPCPALRSCRHSCTCCLAAAAPRLTHTAPLPVPQLYYELAAERAKQGKQAEVALIRIEQLAPFPFDLVMREMRRFPNAGAVRWAVRCCARSCGRCCGRCTVGGAVGGGPWGEVGEARCRGARAWGARRRWRDAGGAGALLLLLLLQLPTCLTRLALCPGPPTPHPHPPPPHPHHAHTALQRWCGPRRSR